MEPSQDYGSLSGMDDDAWAANQVSALRGMKSADFSVPYGSSPQRVRIMQDDYNAYEPKRYAADKGSHDWSAAHMTVQYIHSTRQTYITNKCLLAFDDMQ